MTPGAALRRSVTVPVVAVVEIALLAAAPLLVPAAVGVSLLTGSTRPLRTTLFLLVYAALELSVLVRMLRAAPEDWPDLLSDTLRRADAVFDRVLDVHLVVEPGSVEPAALHLRPLVVLARHCGPGDSLFLADLLVVRYRLRLAIVLTALFRLEPAVDVAGDHLPLCFIGHGRRSATRCIAATARMLHPGDALLLFPEGGNFSRLRRHRAIGQLVRTGQRARARLARRRRYTLPPRLGGAYAALTAAPDADVLLLAHTGFARDGRERHWWRLPMHRTLLAHTTLVPAAEVPRAEPTLSAWLDKAWGDVDAWVTERTS